MLKYSTWVYYYKNKTFIVELLKTAELSVKLWLEGRNDMNHNFWWFWNWEDVSNTMIQLLILSINKQKQG